MIIQEDMTINDTRIQYLLVGDKLYQVTHIDFSELTIEGRECDLDVDDVPEEELWDISDLKEFRIRLVNKGGVGEVIDFREWREEHWNRKS